ncbi:universal stress protein [Streptomyces sp. NBC_01476]|uniref:universal stress protein n=1 Tax=Streptomyces sp. NBC_01476 TaxID=2903881 RepID=UPI002E307E77|nr:universal stress protein [Streptomyces sp. NBC_01476]
MDEQRSSVVAGVSRTRTAVSERVVLWAADEAASRGLPLCLLHAQEWPRGAAPHVGPDHPSYAWSRHYLTTGRVLLEEERRAVLARYPALEVNTQLAAGRPVHVLREAGERAALLVVGARKLSGLQGSLSDGGKGEALLGHLPCPLALIPEAPGTTETVHAPEAAQAPGAGVDTPPDAPVVVGVDGSAASQAAVGLAFAEAAAAKAPLVAVRVCRPREAAWPDFPERAEPELSGELAGHREQYPDTEVRYEVLIGDPAHMLSSAARYARCLVVGTRGQGGFRGMLLGSTSRSLVHRTYCPLLVTPPPDGR